MTDIPAARAYVYSGDWIAECPRPGCHNAEHLFQNTFPGGPRIVRRTHFSCSHCGFEGPIEWPDDRFMMDAMAVLMMRPIPDTRNWYPTDHPTALAAGIAHGQSVKELREESETHGIPCG